MICCGGALSVMRVKPAQIAEPEHRADRSRRRRGRCSPPSTRRPAIAPEIGFDQRPGNARQRSAFHRQRQRGHQPDQGRDVVIGEASGTSSPSRSRRNPSRRARRAGEAIDQGDIVGHALVARRGRVAGIRAPRPARCAGAASIRPFRASDRTGLRANWRRPRLRWSGRIRRARPRRCFRDASETPRPSWIGCSVSTITPARAIGNPAATTRRQNPSSIAVSLSPASPAAIIHSAMVDHIGTMMTIDKRKAGSPTGFEPVCEEIVHGPADRCRGLQRIVDEYCGSIRIDTGYDDHMAIEGVTPGSGVHDRTVLAQSQQYP